MRSLTKILAIASMAILVAGMAKAKQSPFALLTSKTQTIAKEKLAAMRQAEAKPMLSESGKAIVLSGPSASITMTTGPEDDNESYWVAGIRNPRLVLRQGTTLHILFVNVDGDLPHDVRFGDATPPDTSGTVGTIRLPRANANSVSAQEITIQALQPGRYTYFCSVHSHAKNGMRGWIDVLRSNASMMDMMNAK